MLKYPPRLNLARLPTPINRLKHTSVATGVDVYIKRDELTGTEVTGNKIRKLEFSLAEAQAQKCDTLITCGGIQSNHCRATAILGKRLGFKVHLLLRGERPQTPSGNLLLDYLSGATISYLPQSEWQHHENEVRRLQEDYLLNGQKAFYIPVGASDEVGLWGYIAAAEELRQDFAGLDWHPDYIVLATGSGGTQGGLTLGAHLLGMNCKVVAFNVCDDAAWFDNKIRQDVTLWKQRYNQQLDVDQLPVTTIEGYVGPGYGEAGNEVFDTIKQVASSDCVFLDPVYTAKAFHGMVTELGKGESGSLPGASRVLFVHTGGLFGLFPQQEHFHFD
ncbi:MAG: D-cysteine desulfhydrase family protein [Gammaproteobacteria bacterium]